jgi:2-oxo-4-hydroxy-4-carboxy--5-ureidoimidazoline (OHCU) decarboxylase
MSRRFLIVTISLVGITSLILSCSRDSKHAQELLANGSYLEVIKRYPDLAEAKAARAAIAESLFACKEYKAIIDNYAGTHVFPSAYQARALQLIDSGDFSTVLLEYANTLYANRAQDSINVRTIDSIALQLFSSGRYEEILRNYPENRIAVKVRSEHPEIAKKLAIEQQSLQKVETEKKINDAVAARDACLRNINSCLHSGMRQLDVQGVLGSPNDKNSTVFTVLGRQHLNEQWVYEASPYSHKKVYLYFEDSILTSWQY